MSGFYSKKDHVERDSSTISITEIKHLKYSETNNSSGTLSLSTPITLVVSR